MPQCDLRPDELHLSDMRNRVARRRVLFRPADMPDFDKVAEGREFWMDLLAELLRDLRNADGHSQAINEATI